VQGRIKFVGTALDGESRTFPVEVVIPNREGVLKPGMVARVGVGRGRRHAAILVPRDAVLRSQSGCVVYVVASRDGQLVVEARPVTTGAGEGRRGGIETGLGGGGPGVGRGHA